MASGISWFVAVPDTDAGRALVEPLRQRATRLRMLTHASGRPWMLGRWTDDEVAVAELGDRRLVALGEHRLSADDLERRAAGARDAGQMCAALQGLPGSFHALAATPAGTALHGSLSGYRRVYFISVGEQTAAGDRADVLAGLGGAQVDDEALALRMLAPYAPWPIFWQPVWRGVHAVPPDGRLLLDRAAAPRTVTRWRAPEPVLDLATAADRLRRALSDAVAVRAGANDVIASDLSGMDSTSLCALAVRGRSRVVGLTCVSPDPLDDDLPWARRAAAELGSVIHEVVDGEANPLPYDGILRAEDRFDEPTAAVLYRASFLAVSRRAAAHGARTRLTGFGGDELLTADPMMQLTLLTTHPWQALRHLRLLRAAYRWGRRDTLRAVVDRRSYGRWMASLGEDLDGAEIARVRPLLGWGAPATTAPWLTADARAGLGEALRARATAAVPLSGDRGLHGRLAGVYAGAANARHLAQSTRRVGVSVALPYLDDQVLEACLTAHPAHITSPRDYKPLIRAAMQGVVPQALLARDTKADTSIAAIRGALRYRDDLLALADDSRLAGHGLVDVAALRAALRNPDDRTWYDLDQTLACETWLRTVEPAPAIR
ncbi:asparagine synthase-related protein [Plantactinospora sp. KLBMP9567]|uniref:asparagine synthase-related protein n=1 Tax=Plantactinospora sp. KLBMP9567 TaxID=3085900 RepID=UPI0029816831|nr:asparagine synthase-related protein [Plantactinospora sp. KLBMP9567]MDW5324379.1 asparagine synthase-related protein [Plantactinospora sp. KLBMP9567]